MKKTIFFVLLLSFPFFGMASPTRNNDDSCDISVMPAATLLLPYFEVSHDGVITTLFTITNAGPKERIAHVTLWTDLGYPVLDFNIYLTGYDVQSINLYDVIWRGIIAPPNGTAPNLTPAGPFSVPNDELDVSNCGSEPSPIPEVLIARVLSALTLGRVPAGVDPACNSVGTLHTNAVGYATIDIVRSCTTRNPTFNRYLTEDILWDNVLLGDYQQLDRTVVEGGRRNYTEGNPMVHIRAVSEGGTASERRSNPGQYEVTFHRTFYSRFLPDGNRTYDARQPLPAIFAARWIGDGGHLDSRFKVWREGVVGPPACAAYRANTMAFTDAVMFDENENAWSFEDPIIIDPPIFTDPALPLTSAFGHGDTNVLPRVTNQAIAGWVYFNLDNRNADDYASQNWVIVTMRAENELSLDMDAAILGNGCTPPIGITEVSTENGEVIGPAANINP
ncbi:MAG TPA: hypothetical protein VHW00_15025 [Thermoanaerobaculia bacterium]|nr:hypothetical protein [Thermoanaerobaculia bacterium]